MAATTILPEYVVLSSQYNNKYLQFVHVEGELHGFLQFSGHDVVSPYTKFQVQVSGADQTLVHLRSCYNNKYWVPSADNWVLASANEPEEDQTKLSCTLLRPTLVGDAVRFMHVNTQMYVALMDQPGTYRHTCMYLASESPNDAVCAVTDWSSLVILPKNIAVKSTTEGKYLSARPIEGANYLQFVGDELFDPTVGHEVFTSGPGNISIKSQHYDAFWTREPSNFVLAATPDNTDATNPNVLFSLTRIADKDNTFALQSLGNNEHCKIVHIDQVPVLAASDPTITPLSHHEVVDRASSWIVTLEDSDFRVSDVRITVPTAVVLGANELINDSQSDVEMTAVLSYVAKSSTLTWSSTANGSFKVGVTSVGITSPIPVEVDGKIVFNGPISANIVWGEEGTESQHPTHTTFKVRVPPMTKAIIEAVGQKRLWDVPFSYNQVITLYDESKSVSIMDDGIYTGTETNFQYFGVEFVPLN